LSSVQQARRQDFAAGGDKDHKGGTNFFKYTIGCMQQLGGEHEMGGIDFKGGAGHHWP